MFKNLKINNKLKTLSLFSIIIIILLSATNIYLSYKNVTVIKDIYQNNIKALSEMQKIDSKLRDLKYKLAEILLDSVEYDQALDHLTNTKKEIITSWQAMEFEKQIDQISQPEEKTIMLQVIKNWNETLQAIDNVEKAYKGKNKIQAINTLETDWVKITNGFMKPLNELIPLKEKNTKEIYEKINNESKLVYLYSALLSLFSIIIIGMVNHLIGKSITKSIKESVKVAQQISQGNLNTEIVIKNNDEIGQLLKSLIKMQADLRKIVKNVVQFVEEIIQTTEEIAQDNAELSVRIEKEATSLEETAAATEEITSTVKQNANNATKASSLANNATKIADTGGQSINRVNNSMVSITDSAKKISAINNVIDGIAFQTNILALNAAVEAARAGEQGRGFAVVASEVRALAQKSAQAAKEIKLLIENSEKNVHAGADEVTSAAHIMHEIVDGINQVSGIVNEITIASNEQSNGIEQINKTIVELDKMTQQNSHMVAQVFTTTNKLKDQAAQLKDLVTIFKVDS